MAARSKHFVIPPRAIRVLRSCKRMAKLVDNDARRRWELGSPFESLLGSIVSQQISTHAARAIYGRLRARFKTQKSLAEAAIDDLRSVGLSARKAEYIQGLAECSRRGGLRGLDKASDEEVTERIVALRGFGPWSAHMFLMFSLGRPDVWPTGDLGIVRACEKLYGVGDRGDLEELGERFRPWRSCAAYYLWRVVDGDE